MSGETVAVAGGTGFIGRHVVARLRAGGYRVIVLTRNERAQSGEGEHRSYAGSATIDPASLADVQILINCVGIKRASAGASWEQVHVELPRELAIAAAHAGVQQLIHVSVAGCRDAALTDPYSRSKAAGERALEQCASELPQLGITILQPSVVYGRGDDMLRNLADSIRAAPLFPAPRSGRALVCPIAVEDVAEAVLRCIERPHPSLRSFELVGPERLELRDIVARVGRVLERSCVVVPAPISLTGLLADLLERFSNDPLLTRSQLGLLARGVVGDPEPARTALGFEARPLDDDAIRRALASFEPRLPSVRLVPDLAAARELARLGGPRRSAWFVGFALLAVLALLLGPLLPTSIWLRMAGLELLLSIVAIAGMGLAWRQLWRPRADALAWGLGAGVIMWAGALALAAALARWTPELWAQTRPLYAWASEPSLALALPLLLVVVAGEEIVWRGTLGLGLVARLGAWPAVLVSAGLFTLAHLSSGPPVLALAAALAGGAWTWLAIRTRSLAASFVAHFVWDAALLWLTPVAP